MVLSRTSNVTTNGRKLKLFSLTVFMCSSLIMFNNSSKDQCIILRERRLGMHDRVITYLREAGSNVIGGGEWE